MPDTKICHIHISDTCTESVPKRIGAYVVTHTFDNIHAQKYVGSTKNLYKRMHGHHNKNMIYVDLYITDDIYLAECLERVLMELINPATNKVILSLSDNDKELMNELLDNTDIKEHISNNIIKINCRYLKYVNKDTKVSNFNYYIEKRTLTVTTKNFMMSFNKKRLAEFGIEGGEYNVVYEDGKITIVKELKSVVI